MAAFNADEEYVVESVDTGEIEAVALEAIDKAKELLEANFITAPLQVHEGIYEAGADTRQAVETSTGESKQTVQMMNENGQQILALRGDDNE